MEPRRILLIHGHPDGLNQHLCHALEFSVARPGFAFKQDLSNRFAAKGSTGRSARVVMTMGMPALVYRWYFPAHSLKSLERNILSFVGISPVHETLIGMVDQLHDEGVRKWRDKLQLLGAAAH